MLVQNIAGLYIPQHDYVAISPPTAPTEQKLNAAGLTVAELKELFELN